MLSLGEPSLEAKRAFLARQSRLDFSYADVGATATTPPSGYTVDRTRVQLGVGAEVFLAAKAALAGWRQFELGWVSAWPNDTPLEPGASVAVVARALGVWALSACRIIYLINETGTIERFGFAYGTLPDHVGRGEERFLVEWDRATDQVWYDILAFSNLRLLAARLAYPIFRPIQQRFGRESAAAMQRAVSAKP